MTEPERLSPEEIEEITRRVNEGQVFVFPTDTTFGLGASADDSDAVDRIYELKNRPSDKPVPLLTDPETGLELANYGEVERRATERFWPGALTLVVDLPNQGDYPAKVLNEGSVGLRVPAREDLLKILKNVPPIVGTSANQSGEPAPETAEDLDPLILEGADFVIEGESGQKQSSTVVEWDKTESEWIVHRKGPVDHEDLESVKTRSGIGGKSS